MPTTPVQPGNKFVQDAMPGVGMSNECTWTLAQWIKAMPKDLRKPAFEALASLEKTQDEAMIVVHDDPGDDLLGCEKTEVIHGAAFSRLPAILRDGLAATEGAMPWS